MGLTFNLLSASTMLILIFINLYVYFREFIY